MALGGVSPESSMEDLVPPKSFVELSHAISSMRQPLQTYNKHLFPRKNERNGSQDNGGTSGEGDGGMYEMERLEGGERKRLSD
jgi:hypothetical protein